jgi:hypothetical protein
MAYRLSYTVVLDTLVYYARVGPPETGLGWVGKTSRNTSYIAQK